MLLPCDGKYLPEEALCGWRKHLEFPAGANDGKMVSHKV